MVGRVAVLDDLDPHRVPLAEPSAGARFLADDVVKAGPGQRADRRPVGVGIRQSHASLGRHVASHVKGQPHHVGNRHDAPRAAVGHAPMVGGPPAPAGGDGR